MEGRDCKEFARRIRSDNEEDCERYVTLAVHEVLHAFQIG